MARESHLTWDMRLPDERKILAGNDEAPETALVAPDAKSRDRERWKPSSLVNSQLWPHWLGWLGCSYEAVSGDPMTDGNPLS